MKNFQPMCNLSDKKGKPRATRLLYLSAVILLPSLTITILCQFQPVSAIIETATKTFDIPTSTKNNTSPIWISWLLPSIFFLPHILLNEICPVFNNPKMKLSLIFLRLILFPFVLWIVIAVIKHDARSMVCWTILNYLIMLLIMSIREYWDGCV